jgi:hypothetical protein
VKTLLSLFVRISLLLALCAATDGFAQKRKESTVRVPPPPIPRKVTIDRGQQVTIPLAVYGAGAENMQFIIRALPKVGRLSPVQVTGEMTAAVTYFVPEDTLAFQDQFTYAVRTADGVSAAVPVVISIAEAAGLPPRLVVPGSLDMEPIRPGEKSTITVAIKNAGGGFAEGELSVPPPWKIEGSPEFRLGGGSKTDFTVSYSGGEIGQHKADITYGRGYRVSTTLNVAVLQPFTITPALLELVAKPGVATRTGQVRLKNEGTEPMMVSIKHGGKLLTESSITVPGRDSATLAVFVEPGEVGEIQDRLVLKSGNWSGEVPVISSALGPIVSCKEKSVVFGDATTERTVEKKITVENSGGKGIALKFNTTGPFRTDPTSVALKPKSAVSISVLCKAETEGPVEGKLSIVGEGTDIVLDLSADVKAVAPVAVKPVAKVNAAQAEGLPVSVENSEVPAVAAAQLPTPSGAAELPNMLGKVRSVKPTSAVIEWQSSVKSGHRAQERLVFAAPGTPGGIRTEWRDIAAQFSQDGGRQLCEIRGLRPKSIRTIRILVGDVVECTVNVVTPAKPPFPIGIRGVVLIAMLVIAGRLLWVKWKTSARSGW